MDYIQIHETLNQLYLNACETQAYLDDRGIDSKLQFISNNTIKIGDAYEVQGYPIPILTVLGKGDIGFNLDGRFYEFFIRKETALRLDIETLSQTCAVEVYGAKDCEKDYYRDGMSGATFKNGVENSKENAFGICFYPGDAPQPPEEIYKTFETFFQLLIKGA